MTSTFERRLSNFEGEGELPAFNLAAVAEALDTIEGLRESNVGGEVVEKRIGEYKSWDPEILRVDKDVEDGYVDRLRARGLPVVLLSEELGRLEINRGKRGESMYAVSDPFDGSYLFKRGIPDFWYSSLAFYDAAFNPVSCVVGDGVHKTLAFANENGAFIATLKGDGIVHRFRLDAKYREALGRRDLRDLEKASIESYAMKPKKFLLPLLDEYRDLLKSFKFFLPNGGPYGFVDVAEGKIDVYLARQQPYVDVFSGILIAQQAGVVVTDFEGRQVKCGDNVHGLYDVLVSTNHVLHSKVLEGIAQCKECWR